MQKGNKVAFGIFPTRAKAENCVDVLLNSGFRNEDVSVLLSNPDTSRELAAEKNTKAPEGGLTGMMAGAVAGGTLGLLAGVGALAIPGAGPFIAAGPIMAALAGIGAGAATGSLVGALIGLGIPEYEAKRYEGRVKNGGILVSVHCDNGEWTDKAKNVLKNAGAEDISSTTESTAQPLRRAS